ncbi:MAG: hypothetical protein F4X02_13740 [Chloroflexi bacterium]|nr:hypothetical protein [Chloroflexota bacterium]
MTDSAPLQWLASNGWIVLSGRADALSEIRAQALSRHNASGAIAYISLADDLADALMDDMAELGAASGYLVDLEGQDNNEIYERLSGAAMIVIDAAGQSDHLLRLLRRTAIHALKEALNRGALLFLEGAAAAIAGEFSLSADGRLQSGLNLLQNALVADDVSSPAGDAALRKARTELPDAIFLGLPAGAALALGPDGQVETWGERQAAISLADPTRANPALASLTVTEN